MMLRLFLAVGLVLGIGSLSRTEDKEKEKDKDGFVSLFNGKDLEGWKVMGKEGGFQVKDGILRSEGASGSEWLRYHKKFKNFIYKVDWKVSKDGNSGVFIRADEKGNPWLTGYEIQISNAPRDDEHCTGSLYGYAAVKPRPDETEDKWHTFEIHCDGTKIKVISDGVKCIDIDQSKIDKAKDKPLEGYIGLQDSHSPKGHYIEYKNIKIKVLD